MVHIGEPNFYQAVCRQLAACDLVVAEGVSGMSAAVRATTLACRLPARNRRLGLVEQRIDYPALGVPVIWPDMTGR